MKKTLLFFLIAALILAYTPGYAAAPQEISSFEARATQTVSDDDLVSPYNVTGESLVNIIRGMVDFDLEGASIVFNRRTGQIFVKQTPTAHAVIENVINGLRKARFKQVEIEARLVTIAATDFEGLGIDWTALDFNYNASNGDFGTEIPLDATSITNGASFTSWVNELNDTNYGGQFAFRGLGKHFDIGAAIELLKSRTEVNTLAAPRVTVFNNQRAHLKIEKRQNFISELDASFDTVSNSQSVWFQVETVIRQAQSGTILDVRPSINNDGTITLEMHPNYVTANLTNTQSFTNRIDDADFANEITLPVFESQAIDTSLTIPNGGVAVLGGLVKEEETKSFRKVPVLGDIPVVGKFLFSQEKNEQEKSYLIIFIKAKVKETKKL